MKSYTDLEQSKMLAEFLSLESADMFLALDAVFEMIYWLVENKKICGLK